MGSCSATSVWFPSARRVELRTERVPDPGPHEVRIEALASAISHGTEMLVFRGQVPPGLALDLPTLDGSFSFPIKYGYASVGRVIDVGAQVEHLSQGDHVFTLHPHQSTYVVPASMPVRLPDLLDPVLGVFLANVETALNVVLDAAPRFGERVAVFGAGVVGLLIAQLVRRAGASQVITVEPVAARRELARRLAATATLAPDSDIASELRALTHDSGVDVAIEASGNAAALQQAIDGLAFGGTVVVCSWYGTKAVSLELGGGWHRRRPRMISSQVGSIDGALQPRWTHHRRLELATELLASLDLRPLISQRFPITHAAEAYALVDERPAETVQVVLDYSPGAQASA